MDYEKKRKGGDYGWSQLPQCMPMLVNITNAHMNIQNLTNIFFFQEIQSGPHSYKSTIVSQTSFQDESSSVSLMGSERGGDGNIDSTSSLTPPLPRSDLSR